MRQLAAGDAFASGRPAVINGRLKYYSTVLLTRVSIGCVFKAMRQEALQQLALAGQPITPRLMQRAFRGIKFQTFGSAVLERIAADKLHKLGRWSAQYAALKFPEMSKGISS